ncbi:hypothetical protein [Streptomyces sp. NPDC047123]|uniref:hypothetical protein n=1 Tax=Streptomyces sp. NPDC047123 TaxID=3155622 RepID=UPI00340A858F
MPGSSPTRHGGTTAGRTDLTSRRLPCHARVLRSIERERGQPCRLSDTTETDKDEQLHPRSDDAKDPAQGKEPGTPTKPDKKCTDQLNHADDTRSNAEINSIGEETGTRPPVKQR